eukprot:TRINITY_DN1272_c0_g2_i1.p1 TRINITY_DN1272_c0_g2~~TRINITY_DN1272_c0_g2_i1.p1  ORF type:complete len:211 (+),score=-14.06 TRINITY_DN1272_c0_g2_i1:508-1140(+)
MYIQGYNKLGTEITKNFKLLRKQVWLSKSETRQTKISQQYYEKSPIVESLISELILNTFQYLELFKFSIQQISIFSNIQGYWFNRGNKRVLDQLPCMHSRNWIQQTLIEKSFGYKELYLLVPKIPRQNQKRISYQKNLQFSNNHLIQIGQNVSTEKLTFQEITWLCFTKTSQSIKNFVVKSQWFSQTIKFFPKIAPSQKNICYNVGMYSL